MSNSDTTWTAARLSWPSLFPDFQARIPDKSLQEMELNSVLLECGLDSATNEWQMWYMTLMRLGYKKMVTSALNSLALSLHSLTEGKQAVLAFKQPPCETHVVQPWNFWSTAREELSLPTTLVLSLEVQTPHPSWIFGWVYPKVRMWLKLCERPWVWTIWMRSSQGLGFQKLCEIMHIYYFKMLSSVWG